MSTFVPKISPVFLKKGLKLRALGFIHPELVFVLYQKLFGLSLNGMPHWCLPWSRPSQWQEKHLQNFSGVISRCKRWRGVQSTIERRLWEKLRCGVGKKANWADKKWFNKKLSLAILYYWSPRIFNKIDNDKTRNVTISRSSHPFTSS